MKRDFNAWLASLGAAAPVKTLTELREWNLAHAQGRRDQVRAVAPRHLGRDGRRSATARGTRRTARRTSRSTAAHGIDEVMKAEQLDALLFPGGDRRRRSPRRPGYPTVIVPFGMVPNAPTPPFPAGFDAEARAVRRQLHRTACSEPRLIELAYAFEQATKRRVPPPSVP